jgi:hypothetical protein
MGSSLTEPVTSSAAAESGTQDSTTSAARNSTTSDSQAHNIPSCVLSGSTRPAGFPSSSTSSVVTSSVEPSSTISTSRPNEIKTVSISQGPPTIASQLDKRATITSRLSATTVTSPVSLIPREKTTIVSKPPTTTGTPRVSSAHHKKTTGEYTRNSSDIVEEYELVCEAELDEEFELDDEFDFLAGEGPSAVNGKKK